MKKFLTAICLAAFVTIACGKSESGPAKVQTAGPQPTVTFDPCSIAPRGAGCPTPLPQATRTPDARPAATPRPAFTPKPTAKPGPACTPGEIKGVGAGGKLVCSQCNADGHSWSEVTCPKG